MGPLACRGGILTTHDRFPTPTPLVFLHVSIDSALFLAQPAASRALARSSTRACRRQRAKPHFSPVPRPAYIHDHMALHRATFQHGTNTAVCVWTNAEGGTHPEATRARRERRAEAQRRRRHAKQQTAGSNASTRRRDAAFGRDVAWDKHRGLWTNAEPRRHAWPKPTHARCERRAEA